MSACSSKRWVCSRAARKVPCKGAWTAIRGPQQLPFHVDAEQKVTGVEFIMPMNRR
jgi:hypothetical protein